MESTCLWKGSVEKRGNDVIRRWMKRELIVYPSECLYFSPGSGELRGYIPFAQSTTMQVEGDVVKILTVGREHKKSTERNGRSFEFRITDSYDRSNFVSVMKMTLNALRSQHVDGVEYVEPAPSDTGHDADAPVPPSQSLEAYRPPPGAVRLLPPNSCLSTGTQGHVSRMSTRSKKTLAPAEVKAQAGGSAVDLDDYYENLADRNSTETSRLEAPQIETGPQTASMRRMASYHEVGEDEVLDISEVERASEAAQHLRGETQVMEEASGFLFCTKLFVANKTALDQAWENLCRGYNPPSSNPLLQLQPTPFCSRGNLGHEDWEALTLAAGQVDTIEDLYHAVIGMKPLFDNLLASAVESLGRLSPESVEEVQLHSRVVSPHEVMEAAQLCGAYNFFTTSCATSYPCPQPPYSPALQSKVLPEACMCNILSGKISCRTPQQIVGVVDALQRAGTVVFLDNRFVNPLGSPPERDVVVMPLEGSYYCEGYKREVRVIVNVKCPQDVAKPSPPPATGGHQQRSNIVCTSLRCEVIITLQDFDDISASIVQGDDDLFEESARVQSGVPLFNTLLRSFFLQYRSWCVSREEIGLNGPAELSPSVVRLYYQRDIESRVNMLSRVASLSPQEYETESEMFMQRVESAAYLDHPTTYQDDNFFMCIMQDVCCSGDVVMMRALCSLFCEMSMYAGCAAVQRQLLRHHTNTHPTGGGEVAMSITVESLSCALLLEGTVDSIEEGITTSEESLTMREGFHMAERQTPNTFPAYSDITALSDIMLLHARMHYEAGDVTETQSILERAVQYGAQGSRRGLAIVKHHIALFHMSDGSFAQAMVAFEEVLKMYRKNFGIRHPLVAALLLDMCQAYTQAGNFEQAEKVGKKGLTIRIDSCGMSHPSVADAFLMVTPALNLLGKAADSKAYIEKAVKIRKDYFGWLHSSVAECFLHYGVVCKRMGNEDVSRTYLCLGMKMLESKLQDKKISQGVSVIVRKTAVAMTLQDELDIAKRLMEVVIRYQKDREAMPELNDKATVVLDMSKLCLRMGDMANAEMYAQDGTRGDPQKVIASKAPASRGTPRHAAESSLVMSRVLQAKQRYEDAMSWNEKALRSAQARRGLVHSSVVKIKQDMADILLNTGRLEEAVSVLYCVVALQRELYKGADCPDVAIAMYHLALALIRLRLCCEAKAVLMEALHMMLRWNGNDEELAVIADIYFELANCMEQLDAGDAVAAEYGRKAGRIAETVLGLHHDATRLFQSKWGISEKVEFSSR